MNTTGISHALLLSGPEVDATGFASTFEISRPRPTALRGRIGLADPQGIVFAQGVIAAVEQANDPTAVGPASYQWRLTEIEMAPARVEIRGRLIGPLWARLSLAERQMLAGGGPPEEAEGIDEQLSGVEDLDPEVPRLPEHLATASADSGYVETSPELDSAEGPNPLIDDGGDLERPPPGFEAPDDELSDGVLAEPVAAADAELLAESGQQAMKDAAPEEMESPSPGIPARPGTEPGYDAIEAARERAMAFVPERSITEDAARALLVDLRETEVKPTFPGAKTTAGILRKTLLERLLDEAVESEEDFERLIPREVRAATDPDQIAAYLSPIVQILAKIR